MLQPVPVKAALNVRQKLPERHVSHQHPAGTSQWSSPHPSSSSLWRKVCLCPALLAQQCSLLPCRWSARLVWEREARLSSASVNSTEFYFITKGCLPLRASARWELPLGSFLRDSRERASLPSQAPGQACQHTSGMSPSGEGMSAPAGSLHAWLKHKTTSEPHRVLQWEQLGNLPQLFVNMGGLWEINHYYTSQDRALLISPVSVEKEALITIFKY